MLWLLLLLPLPPRLDRRERRGLWRECERRGLRRVCRGLSRELPLLVRLRGDAWCPWRWALELCVTTAAAER